MCKWDPRNQFLFFFCHSYQVDVGWGCGCCGCRAFPFSLGVFIFSVIMVINSIKDLYDITLSDYLTKEGEDNKLFVIFFYIKLVGDSLCILAILIALFSVCLTNYCCSVVSYYFAAISFLLNTSFCIYILTVITTLNFWWNVGFLKIFTVIMWYVWDYVWLVFTWILFCNMVDISRKKQEEESKKDLYNFGFLSH